MAGRRLGDGNLEGEPELVDNYIDTFNGGCNSEPPIYLWLEGEENCGSLCGVGGWYDHPDGVRRDTDWYLVTCVSDVLEVTADADFPATIFIVEATGGCDNDTIEEYWAVGPCNPVTISFPTNPQRDLFIVIAANSWETPGDTFQWSLDVCGIATGPVSVEGVTWGGIKSMYH